MDQRADAGGPLSPEEWRWVSEHLPIACADILPVVRGDAGLPRMVGLIKRESPMGEVWCHVGGRVHHGETLLDAARRHLRTTFVGDRGARLSSRPFHTAEYFPDVRPGAGHDPRKHAVASCFYEEFPAPLALTPQGEALEFHWYAVDDIPHDSLWPGTMLTINARTVPAGSWFVRQRSRHWWMATLTVFGVSSAVVGVLAVLGA